MKSGTSRFRNAPLFMLPSAQAPISAQTLALFKLWVCSRCRALRRISSFYFQRLSPRLAMTSFIQ